MADKQVLPTKEQGLFKKLMRMCEQKQYKIGLKIVKQILSNPKCAEHGETIAMKGLIMSCMGKKTEARELVKQGLLYNLKSHVCWHVSGLIERSDRDYEKAIKCYINALKWDKENMQILRDLSMLQVHIRDLNAFKESRYTLLRLRPTHRVNWIAYSISHHLLKEYDVAIKLLDQLKGMESDFNFEYSELLLYQNSIMQEAGYIDDAIKHLEENDKHIVDQVSAYEYKVHLLTQKGQNSEASQLLRKLIARNPEKSSYYEQLISLNAVSGEQQLLTFFTNIRGVYPRNETPRRLQLQYLSTEGSFGKVIDEYLRNSLVKGLPALFRNIKCLYSDPAKVSVIEETCLRYQENLRASNRFSPSDPAELPPTVVMWNMLFLAQHFDHLGKLERAIEFVDRAIDHTPTLLESLLVKAKILKHSGDIESACVVLDECQSLDTADRFINCKCAKYLLRANKVQQAADMCLKFTREGQDAMENLNEMQCMWFLTESAAAYHRLGQLGDALKKCHEVMRHFDEILDGQFDFHSYSMRKMTLRAYVQLLKLEDRIYDQRFFHRAASIAIQIYLHLHDHPVKEEVVDESTMTPQELKAWRRKKRQEEEARKKAEEEEKKKQAQKKKDEDNDGPCLAELVPEKLEKTESPLEEASRFLKPLVTYATHRVDTYLLAFEVYYRKRLTLLMLRSLKCAQKLEPENPRLHVCLAKFSLFLRSSEADRAADDVMTSVVTSQSVLLSESIGHTERLNQQFTASHPASLPHKLAGCVVSYLLNKENVSTYLDDLEAFIAKNECSLDDCREVFSSVRNGDFGEVSSERIEKLSKLLDEKFPLSSCFKKPQDQPAATAAAVLTNGESGLVPNGVCDPQPV